MELQSQSFRRENFEGVNLFDPLLGEALGVTMINMKIVDLTN